MQFKPFYKSKTVITAVVMLLAFIVDAAFSLNIAETVNEQLSAILTADPITGEVTKINFSALFALASMLVLRLISTTGVTNTMKKAQEKNAETVTKTFLSIPPVFREPILKKLADEYAKDILPTHKKQK